MGCEMRPHRVFGEGVFLHRRDFFPLGFERGDGFFVAGELGAVLYNKGSGADCWYGLAPVGGFVGAFL